MVECIVCGKEFYYSKTGDKEGVQILGPEYVCYDCWESVGFKRSGLMSKMQATHDKGSFLACYVQKHPDAIEVKEKLNAYKKEQVDKAKKDVQDAFDDIKSSFKAKEDEKQKLKEYKKKKYKEKTEEEYTCTKCGATWYNDASDATRNAYNILNTNVNRIKDLSQCPKCGSRASRHKTVSFWVDKDGNFVE